MENNNYERLDEWRKFFKGANVDIFVVIKHAFMVAALDYPNELRENRCSISEWAFNSRVTWCFGCDSIELTVPHACAQEVEARCRCRRDNNPVVNQEMETGKSNVGDKMTETGKSNDEINEECLAVVEVMRIKDILDNHGQESEAVVIDSLKQLQSMTLSIETLKVTDIEKSVSPLEERESKEIKQLVRALIQDWDVKIDELWVQVIEAAAGTECTPEPAKAPLVEEEEEDEGLASPPMDVGDFLTISAMELSKFFDDMEEHGNFRISGEFNETQNVPIRQQQTVPECSNAAPQLQHSHTEKPKEEEAVMKKNTIMADPQQRYTDQQPKAKEPVLKNPKMAAPQDSHTEKPKEQDAIMKKPKMAAPQRRHTDQQKEQQTVRKKPVMAAPQNRLTKQPKEQEAVVRKVSNAAAQDWYTKQQPKEQEAQAKNPSNAASQHRCTQQPKQQGAVLKKPSNSVAQDWYTPQPKEQEAHVLKKPSNASAQDWFTPPPKEQEAEVKKPAFIRPNRSSANGSGPGRPTKPTGEHKVTGNAGVKFQLRPDNRHAVPQQNKLNCPEEITVQERVALAKRKLQERNQAREDAKKRRISQSGETHNTPKQSLDPKTHK